MYILGDIGNSETKVYLVNSKNRIIRNTNFSSSVIAHFEALKTLILNMYNLLNTFKGNHT